MQQKIHFNRKILLCVTGVTVVIRLSYIVLKKYLEINTIRQIMDAL